MTDRWSKFPWTEVGIVFLAVVLRLVALDIKPPHFDEGVNGWFVQEMVKNGYYAYDPTNYHGPLHFYAIFLSESLLGHNIWGLRMPAIVASVLCVIALFGFREFFGALVVRLSAFAMAISTGPVFYGRYSIHESWQVLFSIIMFWGVLGLWQKGDRRFLWAVIAGFTGMVLVKETYTLHAGCLLLAMGVLWIWQKVIPSRPAYPLAQQAWTRRDLGLGVALGIFAVIFFYSGTFLHFEGLKGLMETFAAWFHTGTAETGHEKTAYSLQALPAFSGRHWASFFNYYWLALLGRYEWPGLLGLMACFLFIGPSDARWRLLAIYGAGVLLAYTLIPYKTPWCIISILWPFLLLFGELIRQIVQWKEAAATFIALVVFAYSAVATSRLNFINYTNEKEPYVYVQTYPEIKILTDPLLFLAAKDSRYYHVHGQILLDSYYPLPWILGEFTDVGYFGKDSPPAVFNGDFIVVERERGEKEVEPKLGESYYKKIFRLRDSQNECVVYFRKARFGEYFTDSPIVGPER